MKKKRKNKYSIIDVFRYNFDNFISRGIKGVVVLLFASTIVFVLVVTTVSIRIDGGDANTVLWNNLAAAINSWWPFTFDEDEVSNITLVSRAVIAVFGLFFTSILIGVISERIEIKVRELRKGKSNVIEKNHVIIVGYDSNNLTLLKELILATKVKRKILIIDEGDKDEIEQHINSNINVPKNIKIIIRTFEPWDIENLKKCNVENSFAVVISPMSDIKTLKTIMAVKKILKSYPKSKTHIVSGISNSEYMLNFSNERDVMFQINNLIAKIIATSNNQIGLAKIITSIISFEGAEFYIDKNPSWIGKTFSELMMGMADAVPIGILRDNSYIIIPKENEIVMNKDELLYYSENVYNTTLIRGTNNKRNKNFSLGRKSISKTKSKNQKIIIFGCNSKLEIIYNDFGENVKNVFIAGVEESQLGYINCISKKRKDISTKVITNYLDRDDLRKIIRGIDHVIILCDENSDYETSDVENMLLYLKLIRNREQMKLNFTIITELNSDENKDLIESKYNNDFIVSSNICAMMLVQMVEDARLRPLFLQLLSDEGMNIILKDADSLIGKNVSVFDIRMNLFRKGYIFIGYVVKTSKGEKYVYNPKGNEEISFKDGDKLILIENEK